MKTIEALQKTVKELKQRLNELDETAKRYANAFREQDATISRLQGNLINILVLF